MDMHKNESDWLEPALRRDLSKVEAPAELWERVQRPAVVGRETGSRPVAWAIAAVVFGVAGVLGLRAHESHAAGAAVAERAGGAEFLSGNPVQIRGWVRSSTGLDLALPAVLDPSIHLMGARVVNPAVPAVEVSYRVGSHEATLLVARSSGSAGARHADLRTVNNDGKITWVMHGQVYTLLCVNPEDARVACLLCHAS